MLLKKFKSNYSNKFWKYFLCKFHKVVKKSSFSELTLCKVAGCKLNSIESKCLRKEDSSGSFDSEMIVLLKYATDTCNTFFLHMKGYSF